MDMAEVMRNTEEVMIMAMAVNDTDTTTTS